MTTYAKVKRMADRHIGSPITWAKRYIASADLTDEDRRHVQLWAEKFLEIITQDPRHEAVALNVLCDYTDLIAVRSKAKAAILGSDLHHQLSTHASRISSSLMKWLRLSALRTNGKTAKTTSEKGEIFTAPREPKAAELQASKGYAVGGDAA